MINYATYSNERFSIKLIESKAELDALGKIRFEILALEQSRKLPKDMINKQMVLEEADKDGQNIIALDGNSSLIACLRINRFDKQGTEKLLEAYKINKDEYKNLAKHAVISRFMVRKERRKTKVIIELVRCAHQYCIENNIDFIYVLASDISLNLCKRIGFKVSEEHFKTFEGYLVSKLVINIKDKDYFQQIQSPLLVNFT